jgi:hypothetical protein
MTAVRRATNEAGETYDDPSEDLLFELLDELAPGNSFVIVDRLEPDRAGHFMQAVIGPVGSPWILEYPEGPQETHRSTSLDSMRTVHEVMTKWAFDLPGWRDGLVWDPVHY